MWLSDQRDTELDRSLKEYWKESAKDAEKSWGLIQ